MQRFARQGRGLHSESKLEWKFIPVTLGPRGGQIGGFTAQNLSNGVWALAKLGFGRYPLFHGYFIALLVLGERRCSALIAWIKRRLGYTPALGSLTRANTRQSTR